MSPWIAAALGFLAGVCVTCVIGFLWTPEEEDESQPERNQLPGPPFK